MIMVRECISQLNMLYAPILNFSSIWFVDLFSALSTRMIERIFSGAVTRGSRAKNNNNAQQPEDKMSYTEFVWFLLSEEDKNHPTAIEYWFR